MKRLKSLIYSFLILAFCHFCVAAQSELNDVKKWFSAWELVSKEIYKINTLQPVDFVFFDETYVYSTSQTTVQKGEFISGPSLFNQKLAWKKAAHNGKITLPDSQIVPVNFMSFAAPFGEKSFFVMPLLKFWQNTGIESKELGFENLVTGVFLHEFSHSQQMRNFGKKLSVYEQKYTDTTVEFSDDLIQNYFKNDLAYTQKYLEESNLFYEAVESKSRVKLLQAMALLKNRQQRYFVKEKVSLRELDDFFLTMEGLGQFTMYAWMIHPKGGNVAKELAITGVRRGKKWWSQDEGLALFLVLNNFSNPSQWSKLMFGKETVSIIDLIKKELR